jgi:hypothetical protein
MMSEERRRIIWAWVQQSGLLDRCADPQVRANVRRVLSAGRAPSPAPHAPPVPSTDQ